jgi:hypothetical protein
VGPSFRVDLGCFRRKSAHTSWVDASHPTGGQIHFRANRSFAISVQHRFEPNLCQRNVERRRHGVCAVVQAVRSHRGCRNGRGRTRVVLVWLWIFQAGADNCVSRYGRQIRALPRREVADYAQTACECSRLGGRCGATNPVQSRSDRHASFSERPSSRLYQLR